MDDFELQLRIKWKHRRLALPWVVVVSLALASVFRFWDAIEGLLASVG